ncbi:hypothetical protein A4A49_40205 [Nicotiana attenuata]|uniref:Uncharacterized protein n=1 Tax=Nicotiana attenuata TaxID=49451 RepID=A0A1J6KKF3_NICAT|nr:hypothetical protein A4A49_40205 [Nicotiana attenuata]
MIPPPCRQRFLLRRAPFLRSLLSNCRRRYDHVTGAAIGIAAELNKLQGRVHLRLRQLLQFRLDSSIFHR